MSHIETRIVLTLDTDASSTKLENDSRSAVDDAKVEAQSEDRDVATRRRNSRLAWNTVVGAWLVQFLAVGVISSFGVFQEFYTATWLPHASASAISWIGSVQLFLQLALGPIGGKLLDSGHFRLIVVFGCTLFVFSFFMLSLAKPGQYYQVFLSQALAMGIGGGLVFLPTSALVSKHFKQRRAFAMGIVATSVPIGGVIFSIALNYLVHGRVGFAWGVRVVAFISVACFAGGISLMALPASQDSRGAAAPPAPRPSARFFDADYVLVLCYGFVVSLGVYFPTFYVQLFAELHGLDETLSFYALAVLNVSAMFGRVVPNYVADRVGVLNVVIPCIALNGILGFGMLGCGTPQGLVLFTVFYGFFFGSTISLYLPLIASMSPEGVDVGKRMGIGFLPLGVASLIGPPITGAILGPHFMWWKGITFASVTIIMGVVPLLIIKYRQLKQRRLLATAGSH